MSSRSWISDFTALPPAEKRAAWENLTDQQKWQLQERYMKQKQEGYEKDKKKADNKWLVHDGPVKGLVRRKGEKDPNNYGIYFDDALLEHLPKEWKEKPDEAPELSGKKFCCFM